MEDLRGCCWPGEVADGGGGGGPTASPGRGKVFGGDPFAMHRECLDTKKGDGDDEGMSRCVCLGATHVMLLHPGCECSCEVGSSTKESQNYHRDPH